MTEAITEGHATKVTEEEDAATGYDEYWQREHADAHNGVDYTQGEEVWKAARRQLREELKEGPPTRVLEAA